MSGDPTRPESGEAPQPSEERSLFGEPAPEAPPASPQSNLFGEIEPPPEVSRDQIARARAAQRQMDSHLGRMQRRGRFRILRTIALALFTIVFVIPLGWVLLYGFLNPPTTITMLIRAGQGQSIRYEFVSIDRISPNMIRSVIAAEDAKFCSHDGFDIEAIEKALEHNEQGGRQRGASTISQQTAKNLFLWTGGGWLRKAVEAYFTFLIENLWSKRRIMELYLNVAEFGDGYFGAEAAAQGRFHVPAARLSRLQAARLAAILPSPNRYDAVNPGRYVRRQSAAIMARANVVGGSEGGDDCVLGR